MVFERMRIEAQNLVSRLGGFSVSATGGGVSFRLPESEKEVVREVIIFLEDRRALYVDFNLEVEEQVVTSVLEIRKELTAAMKRVGGRSPAYKAFEVMRAECREFLSGPFPAFPHIGGAGRQGRGGMDAGFFAALGKLRAIFGQQLAALAYLYGLDLSAPVHNSAPGATSGRWGCSARAKVLEILEEL